MRRKPLESLGAMVRERRGRQTLRAAAAGIGIGAATLLRVESGRVPDVDTFGRLCRWLEVDPGLFLGVPSRAVGSGPEVASAITISAHYRADQSPKPETARALASMLLRAAELEPAGPSPEGDDHP